MKRLFCWLCFFFVVMLITPTQGVSANGVMESIIQDEDGQIEFKYLDEDPSATSLENYPIRIRLEELNTDQAQMRMIWDLNDPNLDETFPVTITKTMNEPIPVKPDGSDYMAAARISIDGASQDFYGGDLYLTDLPSHSGLQLMMADYVNNQEGQKKYHIMMTQIKDANLIGDEAWSVYFEDLDQQMLHWQDIVGGKFYRIYPENGVELDHGGLSFHDLMEQMTLDGVAVNPLTTEGYTLYGVYSTAIKGRNYAYDAFITYVMLEYQGEAQVWVTEQTDTSNMVDFHLTENADIRHLFEKWYYYIFPEAKIP